MTGIIYFFVLYVIFLLGDTCRLPRSNGDYRNAKRMFTVVLITAIICIVFFLFDNAVDSANYRIHFLNSHNSIWQLRIGKYTGFWLMRLVRQFGGDYRLFRGVVGAIFCLPYLLIAWNNDRVNVFQYGMLLMILPMAGCIINLFSSLAMSVSVAAFYYYLHSGKKLTDFITSVALLVFSATIHDTSLFFVPIFFSYLTTRALCKHKRDEGILGIAGTFSVIMAMFLFRTHVDAISSMAEWLGINGREDILYGYVRSGYGFLVAFFSQITIMVLFVRMCRNIQRNDQNAKNVYGEYRYLAYASAVLLPFYILNVGFIRYFWTFFYLFASIFADDHIRIRTNRTAFAVLGVMMFALFWLSGGGYFGADHT